MSITAVVESIERPSHFRNNYIKIRVGENSRKHICTPPGCQLQPLETIAIEGNIENICRIFSQGCRTCPEPRCHFRPSSNQA